MVNSFGANLRRIREEQGLTQEGLATKLETSKQVISRYENDHRSPKVSVVAEYAKKLGVSLSRLTGTIERDIYSFPNIHPISTQRFKVLGSIACGEPTYAEEELESYIELNTNIQADFILRAKGDSMIGLRINDGDIVFIREQPQVEQGEVAAVCIGDEATLKRFYQYGNIVLLQSANPSYEDIEVNLDEVTDFRILGKAIAFQSDVR
ncbi:MAG: helix-turn-helix domain-containing protein [Dehalococcoidia bacterium]|nr:helix-turn-helix domain-containing protein [Dehalococcoidia bacterium]